MAFIYPALNLDSTSLVKLDVARYNQSASILRGAGDPWGWRVRTTTLLESAVASVHLVIPRFINSGTLGYDATAFPFGALKKWDSDWPRSSSSEVLGVKLKQFSNLRSSETPLG